jgi:hypothetical protein
MTMAKENPIPSFPNISATASPAAPLFSLARTMLDQIDQQSERLIEMSLERAQEQAQLYRTARTQAIGISRTVLGTVEQLTNDGIEAARSFSRPFVRGAV